MADLTERDFVLLERFENGATVHELAAEHSYSTSWVWKRLSAAREERERLTKLGIEVEKLPLPEPFDLTRRILVLCEPYAPADRRMALRLATTYLGDNYGE